MSSELPPPVEERFRIPLRIAVVLLAYVLYRLPGDDAAFAGRIFIAAGTLAVGWALVERLTVWRKDRSGLMLMGSSLLGIGLIALGLFRL